jgi:polysaccharide biosynthesis/export protein
LDDAYFEKLKAPVTHRFFNNDHKVILAVGRLTEAKNFGFLIRNGATYNLNTIQLEKNGLSLHNLLIRPNDTIFVNTKQDQKLYVMGESSKSQAINLRDQGMSLSDVLGESEGINPYSASAARIYVMRTDLDQKQSTIYHLNLSSIGNLALANQFSMKKNDIVYIDATGLTRWQRVVNQIIPFSSALYSFDQLGK